MSIVDLFRRGWSITPIKVKLGSGYDREKAMVKWVERYKKAAVRITTATEFKEEDVDGDGDLDTKCSWGFISMANELGEHCFDGMRANDIYDYVTTHDDWKEATPHRIKQALDAIRHGGKACAVSRGAPAPATDPSGHCAWVYPGPLGHSGKWNHEEVATVPLVANVGNKNEIMFANNAFGQPECRYFYQEGKL